MSVTATVTSPITSLSIVRSDDICFKFKKNVLCSPVGLKPICVRFHLSERSSSITHVSRVKHSSAISGASQANHASLICGASGMKRASVICASVLNTKCSAEQGQTATITRQSSTITIAPSQGKEKSPELDDGGTGFPPRDDDDGGGGGGGGGGNWSGGFFFFGFLALLGMLKDQEGEGSNYRDQRGRR